MKNISSIICAAIAGVSLCACGGKTTAETTPDTLPENNNTEIKFDADSAYQFIADQVEFGPRVVGSAAHARCADYIAAKLKAYGAEVIVQDTTYTDQNDKSQRVRNIMGRFNPHAERAVMLLAHYDTRPWADEDPDETKHSTPIDGANDGGSGVAVMLEIARNASQLPAAKGLDLLFVDNEDAGTHQDDLSWCIGSQAWAAYRQSTDRPIDYAILLDMVGGKDACFPREYFSEVNAKGVNDLIWATARQLGYANRFPDRISGAINDDHVPLLKIGIPTVDIIETDPDAGGFNPTWHTTADNLQNIDPATLNVVGRTVTAVLMK
ncbi:MAG: M28 family peptidase [Muribaculaceae bacterium]|nr:M28 family peptidase [Muribaculaceae bacterium]